MERAKTIVSVVFFSAAVTAVALLLSMGLEITGHMNPDVLLPEARALACCCALMAVCLFFKLYVRTKESREREGDSHERH